MTQALWDSTSQRVVAQVKSLEVSKAANVIRNRTCKAHIRKVQGNNIVVRGLTRNACPRANRVSRKPVIGLPICSVGSIVDFDEHLPLGSRASEGKGRTCKSKESKHHP